MYWPGRSERVDLRAFLLSPGPAILLAQIFAMLGISCYAVVLSALSLEWQLSNTQAGWIGSSFFAGYILTVSFWSALTDRMDPRRIYLLGCVLGSMGLLAFAQLAQGFYSAFACYALYGVGVAATYMPGLKLMTERYRGKTLSRYSAFYTAFFGFGSAVSLMISQTMLSQFNWHWAFALCAAGPMVAFLLICLRTQALPAASGMGSAETQATLRLSWRDVFPVHIWRQVWQAPDSRLYVYGYGIHCLELFGSRAWVVAFLAFAAASAVQQGHAPLPLEPGTVASLVSALCVGSSILGNEVAMRVGRLPWIRVIMASTMGLMLLMCAAVMTGSWLLLLLLFTLYSLAVMADSATLTAGLVQSVADDTRGAALGLYSLVGFSGAMLGPALFGAVLDFSGGATQLAHWTWGFASLSVSCALFAWFTRFSVPHGAAKT